MSIKNLATYLKNIDGAFQKIYLDELVAQNGGSMEAVIDGVALLYYLYVNRTDSSYGGNFQHFTELCKQFCNNLTSIGIHMTVVFDGVPSQASDENSVKYCSIKCSLNSKSPIIPSLARNILIHILRDYRIPVIVASKEAYRCILSRGKSSDPKKPVLTFGYDASLLIQDIDAYIYIDSISYVMDNRKESYDQNNGESILEHVSAKISYPSEIARLIGLDSVISRGKDQESISPLLILTHLLHADNSAIPEYMFTSAFFQQPQMETESGISTNDDLQQNKANGQVESKELSACNKVDSIISMIKKYCTSKPTDEDHYKELLDEIANAESNFVLERREEQRLRAEQLAKEEEERRLAELAKIEEEKLKNMDENPNEEKEHIDTNNEENIEKEKEKVEQEKTQEEIIASMSPGGLYFTVLSKEEIIDRIFKSIENSNKNYEPIKPEEDQVQVLYDLIEEKNSNDPEYVSFVCGTGKKVCLSRPFISSILKGTVPYEALQALVYRRILLVDQKPVFTNSGMYGVGTGEESSALISRELRMYIYAQLLKGSNSNYVKEIIRSSRSSNERGNPEYIIEKVVVPQDIFRTVPGISGLKTLKPIERFSILCKACGIKEKEKVLRLWDMAGSSTDPTVKETEYEYLIPHILVISYLMKQKDIVFGKYLEKTNTRSNNKGPGNANASVTSIPASSPVMTYINDFVDNINAMLEFLTMPAKVSTIKMEMNHNTIIKNPLSQVFFSEYVFTFNFLYTLNTLLQNPIKYKMQSFAISGVFFLHHKAETSSGRGNLIKWRRRINQKSFAEKDSGSAFPSADASTPGFGEDGFQKVGRDDGKVFRLFRNTLETLTLMESCAYPKGLSKDALDTPRKNSNELIRQFETKITSQTVLKEGASKFRNFRKGGNKNKK